eukprot:GFUD01015115.1.p1 GENE.GFUD01015115.1~~GFUD01015115.1.p1  ORF type:complete len:447 (-),score=74.64 GFUD01015115.1:166-1506(-)
MEEVDISKSEPPDFLSQHLAESIDDPKEFTIQFIDGSVQVDMVVMCAISNVRSVFVDHDQVIVESCLETGKHLVNIIYTGETLVNNEEEVIEIQNLINMLCINIKLQFQERNKIQVDNFEPCTKETNFTVILDDNMSDIENMPDMNSIIMSNMNQNENNIVINHANIGNETMLESKTNSKQVRTLKEKNKKLYACDFHPCIMKKMVFEGISKFKRHTHDIHNEKPLACPEAKNGCKFRADDFSKLGNHVQGVHKDKYSENIICEECHKSFPSQSYLKTHMKRMHKQNVSDREKICPYCGETKLQLNDHIMRAHKAKQFHCTICPKTFKTSVQKRIHHNVHTGFKPYTCKSCDQRFSRLHHRKTHLEKLGHIAGPVLKSEDHVDNRSVKTANVDEIITFENQDYIDKSLFINDDLDKINSDQINKAIGVNCAEIIQNITLGNEDLHF